MSTLGIRLKTLRDAKGVSLTSVSKDTGISISNLSKYEKDNVKPAADAIVALSNYFNVSTDWILKGIKTTPQKNEVIFDPDTRDMIEVVKIMMSDPDPDVRIWAKMQFRRTFPEYFNKIVEEKKEHA